MIYLTRIVDLLLYIIDLYHWTDKFNDEYSGLL